jgi:hypothetical protein
MTLIKKFCPATSEYFEEAAKLRKPKRILSIVRSQTKLIPIYCPGGLTVISFAIERNENGAAGITANLQNSTCEFKRAQLIHSCIKSLKRHQSFSLEGSVSSRRRSAPTHLRSSRARHHLADLSSVRNRGATAERTVRNRGHLSCLWWPSLIRGVSYSASKSETSLRMAADGDTHPISDGSTASPEFRFCRKAIATI